MGHSNILSKQDTNLLIELEPFVAKELNRHEKQRKLWFPHEYIPWSVGVNFDGPLKGKAWSEAELKLNPAARTSLIVNLLTEDNLPSYHREVATVFTMDSAWGCWINMWTAEEDRHGAAIRDYLLVTRSVNPRELELARLQHMQHGFTRTHQGTLHGLAYVSLQELATRVSHRNTGKATGDSTAENLLKRIASDENLHMVFYRNIMNTAFSIAPDYALKAVWESIRDFQMPGYGIEGFARKSLEIAVSGIYDLQQHKNDVVLPTLAFFDVFNRSGYAPSSEKYLIELHNFLKDIDNKIERFENSKETLKKRLVI